jgi:magnesium chelatase family protein
MDRIDLQILVRSLPASQLVARSDRTAERETSAQVAERVARAREIQQRRFAGSGIFTNAEMPARLIERYCQLSGECRELLERILSQMGLSARAYSRILKVSRTIADLESVSAGGDGSLNLQPRHLLEAASYRFLDRKDLLET